MKTYHSIFMLIVVLMMNLSCDNLQQNIEDKGREIQEATNKELDEHLPKVDSAIKKLDSTIQKKIDRQLKEADTLIDNLEKKIN